MSDWRGQLYNLDSVLQSILTLSGDNDPNHVPELVSASGAEPKEFTFVSTGIKSLRDVVKLRFASDRRGEGSQKITTYICPLSQKELGPNTKCVYIVPCGHVFYEAALNKIYQQNGVSQTEQTCPQCNEPFQTSNIVPILPIGNEVERRLADRIENLRSQGLTHNLSKTKKDKDRKSKKGKKRRAENSDRDDHRSKERNDSKKYKLDRINDTMTASVAAKVAAELESRRVKQKA